MSPGASGSKNNDDGKGNFSSITEAESNEGFSSESETKIKIEDSLGVPELKQQASNKSNLKVRVSL